MALTLKIPTPVDFWHWLARIGYRRYARIAKASGAKPVGIPGNRDPDAPCTAFEPRARKHGDFGDCDSDGHYLCAECCHRRTTPPSND